MWLRLFAVLRLPVAIFALLGFASASPGAGAWATIGLYILLAVVTVKLWRARPGALWWASVLLALESVGAVLFLLAVDIWAGRVETLGAAVIAWGVGALWATPNAAVLFLLRSKFVAVPATQRLPDIEARETSPLQK